MTASSVTAPHVTHVICLRHTDISFNHSSATVFISGQTGRLIDPSIIFFISVSDVQHAVNPRQLRR
ncbi:hypothetical protein BIFBIF_00908 [Bifidobacterium bifidum ATCC 29521 = JCM 1255 = DSM 20456]|nr:hypothetical protein BIFBIF_00908 [Bifidobacterium bifidum ATCC 29521 = JCM 1255 = DSM 20456]